jgi:hypothetical protein
MKTIIYTLTLTLLVSACGQTNSNPNPGNKSIEAVETKETHSTDSKESTKPTFGLAQLDSIDKVHNEIVDDSGNHITQAFVYLKGGDSTITLSADILLTHRIFGYAKPDIKSERLLLLSVFTNDVQNNSFGCKLGAYYDTGGMDDLTLKYNSTSGDFIKATATDKANNSTTIYFEKKWIEFMQ